MIDIKTFDFDNNIKNKIMEMKYDTKWPMVYIITGDKEAYIGETANVTVRSYQHRQNEDRKKLKRITFITNNKFNKSVALDLESFLIKYMSADGKYILQNGNAGLQHHEYFQKQLYRQDFNKLWDKLKDKKLVKNELKKIEITNLFRNSPYKSLTNSQNIIITNILNNLISDIKNEISSSFIITGESGTGKTIVAIYLMKLLADIDSGIIPLDFDINNIYQLTKLRNKNQKLEIGLVVPTQALRKTYRKVFKNISRLRANMVITPSEVIKKDYDILIVDESIRLKQRKGLSQDGYATFNRVNKKMGWDKNTTELEWILRCSKYQLFFYFNKQTIRPSDIRSEMIEQGLKRRNHKIHKYTLQEQLRCQGEQDYIKYTRDLLTNKKIKEKLAFKNYEFKIFDNINDMIKIIKEKDKKEGLSRVVAGYAWEWKTKGKSIDKINKNDMYDIKINGNKYIWNTTNVDWVYSDNAINEIGCVHTIHGYDLNYAGVIIGPDLKYDVKKGKVIIDKNNYYDKKGKTELESDKELFDYITNAYHILFTRGIKGTYLYVCDEPLRNYLKQYIQTYNKKGCVQ